MEQERERRERREEDILGMAPRKRKRGTKMVYEVLEFSLK